MSANENMPEMSNFPPNEFGKNDYHDAKRNWLNSLQPCEISESELCLILSNVTKLDYDNPIEVTDIVNASVICKVERCDGECIECNHMAIRIVFKQPKQVEEIEAVAGYVAFNVNGIISGIYSNLEWLKEDYPKSGYYKLTTLRNI